MDINETAAKAQAYQQRHHLTFPVWTVADRVGGDYNIPFNLLIDQGGVVRYAGTGDPLQNMENAIADLFRE